jgi:TonB family protein
MTGPIISAGWVGRIIDGRFALHEWLGGSGSSGVFRTDLPQPVAKGAAIKLIAAEGARADAYLSGWAKDATLSHPHLTRVFRSGRYQFGSINMVYVVTERADEVLSQILPDRALTTDETREMLSPIIEALQYLHEKGFVHGHLKPSNILVVEDQVKLSGDNVAAGGMRNRFEPPQMYDAPEIVSGVLTAAADVWSLGMVLVEALTQRTPGWEPASTREPYVPDGLPRTFAEIARDCLRIKPEERCTLAEIQARLEPSKPIAFPTAKPEKTASSSVDTGSIFSQQHEDTTDLPHSRLRLWPLLAGLVGVLILLGIVMMRNHSKQEGSAPATQSVPAPADSTNPEPPSSPASSGLASAKGSVLHKSMPRVTTQARRTIRGTVVVSVSVAVDIRGTVTNAGFKSSGPSKYFAKTALEAARGWKFTPPRKDGQPVKSSWLLHFRFRESGDEATAVEETP